MIGAIDLALSSRFDTRPSSTRSAADCWIDPSPIQRPARATSGRLETFPARNPFIFSQTYIFACVCFIVPHNNRRMRESETSRRNISQVSRRASPFDQKTRDIEIDSRAKRCLLFLHRFYEIRRERSAHRYLRRVSFQLPVRPRRRNRRARLRPLPFHSGNLWFSPLSFSCTPRRGHLYDRARRIGKVPRAVRCSKRELIVRLRWSWWLLSLDRAVKRPSSLQLPPRTA